MGPLVCRVIDAIFSSLADLVAPHSRVVLSLPVLPLSRIGSAGSTQLEWSRPCLQPSVDLQRSITLDSRNAF